mgnify:CR=1 FL=1
MYIGSPPQLDHHLLRDREGRCGVPGQHQVELPVPGRGPRDQEHQDQDSDGGEAAGGGPQSHPDRDSDTERGHRALGAV